MPRVKRTTPLPRPTEEVKASREATNPPGVFVVRQDKRVTGLHVHPAGIAMLDDPSLDWRPEPPIAKVKRGIFRSRIHITFSDGTKTVIRPYKPGLKGLSDAGQVDSMGTMTPTTSNDPRGGDLDSFVAVIVILAAIVLFPISLFFLAREVFGTSARAKQANIVLDQIRAVIPATGSTIQ